MRAEINAVIKDRWDAELTARQLAKPIPVHWPSECDAYLGAWKKARRNRNKTTADSYIEAAFEEWELAVSASIRARSVLGPNVGVIEDFENLPAPFVTQHRIKESKPEIRAKVLEDFKKRPEHYQPQQQARVNKSEMPEGGKPNLRDIMKKVRS